MIHGSIDNALAHTFKSFFKEKLIYSINSINVINGSAYKPVDNVKHVILKPKTSV